MHIQGSEVGVCQKVKQMQNSTTIPPLNKLTLVNNWASSHPQQNQTDMRRNAVSSLAIYLGAVCWVVEICFSVWMWHTSWITSNNVEVSASCHASLSMPLNLYKMDVLNMQQ